MRHLADRCRRSLQALKKYKQKPSTPDAEHYRQSAKSVIIRLYVCPAIMPDKSCTYCTGMNVDDLQKPYGCGRVIDNNPEHIHIIEQYDGKLYYCCHDFYRRGGRWRAKQAAGAK